MRKTLLSVSFLFPALFLVVLVKAQSMRITEYMYDGPGLEFIEFTNVGTDPVDMTGWSFDDNSQVPGTVDLSAFGIVQPGESVILAETGAAAFRTSWGLCDNVKVIGNLATNLGRADEINLFDAGNALVDRLTYGDEDFPGTIRTQNRSGWVSVAGLGANDISEWTLATLGDAEGSFSSSNNELGSPGKSTRAIVAYDPCPANTIRITEYLYDGANDEFIEFTNIGTAPVDMTGWSFDDNSQIPGTVDLSAFGIVQPGESVILAESSAVDFRAAWDLCDNVKVIGNLATNLGRADEINLFDAGNALVDRLTYGDEDFPGTIRTQNSSGWVSPAGLGANDINEWTLATLGDAEGSFASSGNDIGSPGKSTQATVAYNPCLAGVIRITEYLYDGANDEFIEFTNIGTAPVDMTGWSFDDNSQIPGTVDLSAFGIVQPGESVILAESSAAGFRAAWGLCAGIKIIGGLATNLGRADEINLFDAGNALVDRLTYGDEDFPGTIRTQNSSGWVSAAGLGTNDINEWTLATLGDAEGSFASSGNDIGSPGKSTRAIVAYDPCTIIAGAPTVTINVTTTTDLLDGALSASPVGSYSISGVIDDPADPAATIGIDFTIDDDATSVEDLTVSVISTNTVVVPGSNLVLSGTGSERNLKITPAAKGYSNILVTVDDGTSSTTYTLRYAASLSTTPNSQWLTGIADASAALALDDDYMVIANDEDNLFYVYNRNASGLPLKKQDFSAGNALNLPDGDDEVDVEAVAASIAQPGKSYWLGSMSNSSSSFDDKPNRNRIFAMNISGTGAGTSFTNAGYYGGLREQLVTWGDANGYDFTSSAADGKDPKLIDGFNTEGMVFAPDNTTLYIGFRAPLVPMANRTQALIAPIEDFESWFNNGSPAGNPVIGTPIELDLGGRGIRDMIRLSNGKYVIAAGSFDETAIPAIYRWTGNPADAPQLISSFDVTGINVEALLSLNNGGQLALDKIQVIGDNGDDVFYNDGILAKDLSEDNFKKFITMQVISSAGAVLPVHFEYFTAHRQGSNVVLNWKNLVSDDASSFEIMRSYDGTTFTRLATIPAAQGQSTYTFTDVNAPTSKLYYRIAARDISGASFLSTVRVVTAMGYTGPVVKVYPNPVNDGTFSIQVNLPGVKTAAIYTAAGTLIRVLNFSETAKDISTIGWPKGYYLVKILTTDGVLAAEKILVQ